MSDSSSENGFDRLARSSVFSAAITAPRMISQNTPIATGCSASMREPVLSSMRRFTPSIDSSRRVAARAITAISQPIAKTRMAPSICGM